MTPDPKPEPRLVDRDALKRAGLLSDECASCGKPPANVHHVIPKGSPHFGDDVPETAVAGGDEASTEHGADVTLRFDELPLTVDLDHGHVLVGA